MKKNVISCFKKYQYQYLNVTGDILKKSNNEYIVISENHNCNNNYRNYNFQPYFSPTS